jgi:hypothetical protein
MNITCPKCAASGEEVRFTYRFRTTCKVLSAEEGTLLVDVGFNDTPQDGLAPALRCLKCGASWPLPAGTAVRMKHGDKSIEVV